MEEIAAKNNRVWNSAGRNGQRARRVAGSRDGGAVAVGFAAQGISQQTVVKSKARSTGTISGIHLAATGSADFNTSDAEAIGSTNSS